MTLKPGRSSIFETFFKSAPKDESPSSSQAMPSFGSNGSSSLMLGSVPPKNTDLVVLTDEEDCEAEQEPTLWMSCSPGRDSSDNDAESLTMDCVDAKSDDDDDELPTSQMTGRCDFEAAGCWNSDGHRLDEKSSMKCTLKPKMSVSGYSLFYNDAKTAIVEGNPKAKFAKIANIVATMWDHLDKESKVDYKKKAKSGRHFAKRSTSSERSLDSDTQIKARVRKVAKNSPDQNEQAQRRKHEQSCSKKFYRKEKPLNVKDAETKVDLTGLCRRPDCLNVAVDNPRWSNDYCSSHCIVMHCKDVFNAWVSERQEIFKTCESLQTGNTSDQLRCQ